MKLVKASYTIEDKINGLEILKKIEKAGRTCYKSEDKITDDSAIKFVSNILKSGHESVIEHEKITVRIICDRGISHEIVRHRIGSYSQESTRYANYGKDKFGNECTFIRPPDEWFSGNENKLLKWLDSLVIAEHRYLELLELGWKPQQARSVLPNALKTEIVVTFNLREWRHFFKLRTAKAAHPQMREITIPMLKEFQSLIPVIFNDIKDQ